MNKTSSETQEQKFAFRAPGALRVQLVGDFTHWLKNPIPLHKETDGIWRGSVPLAPGTYHYRFMVDGQWNDDPECTLRVSNGLGGENMVRKVGQPAAART